MNVQSESRLGSLHSKPPKMPGSQNLRACDREQDLAGKVAVVTGASRGIGFAIALHLANRGAAILTTSTGASKHIDQLRDAISLSFAQCESRPPKIAHQIASLEDPNAHVKVADAVQRGFDGQTDIYINNAGISDRTFPGELQAKTLDKILLCNIRTPALITDELVKRRYFRKDSRIIFISSAQSVNCAPGVTIYAATKAANVAMTRCYAKAFGGRSPEFDFMADTTANSVLTGLTETGGVQQYGPEEWERLQEFWVGKQLIPRLGQPDDVADVVGLLCSKEARWITGSKISANGGSVVVV